jgi:acyl-coenzyme A thioesterase PaaI-like protein
MSTAEPGDAIGDEPIESLLHRRWEAPPADWLTPERTEKRRLASAMRAVIEELDTTSASGDEVAAAADELERIALRFRTKPHDTEYEGYRETANVGADVHASFDRSPLIGLANPLAPPLELVELDGVVRGAVTMGSAYEGPPGCVHGGFIAAVFDELLGATQSLSGAPGMTGRLTVHYRSPTPLHAPLTLEGRIASVDGRKIRTEGTLTVGDRLCAEAEGLFISIDAALFAALKAERGAQERGRQSDPGGSERL